MNVDAENGAGLPKRRAFVTLHDVRKRYGSFLAVDGVALDLWEGRVHGLIGANGAGKSTLVKILSGATQPTSGAISVDGQPVRVDTVQKAERLGISVVYQELTLVPAMTALENALIGTVAGSRWGALSPPARRRSRTAVQQLVERLGMRFSVDQLAADLTVEQQRILLIARALHGGSRLLVLDEPTASLPPPEAAVVYGVIEQLRRDGVGVLFISHRLAEVVELCDEATALRGGRVVARAVRGEFTERDLVEAMTGRHETVAAPLIGDRGKPTRTSRKRVLGSPDVPLLELEEVHDWGAVRGISLSLYRGEILGLGGLVGSGRSELLLTIVGARRLASGSIRIDGKRVSLSSPSHALQHGIGLVPEERRAQGLVLDASVAFNISLSLLGERRRSGLFRWFLDRRGILRVVSAVASSVHLIPARTDVEVRSLSGGNQQKVVLARNLAIGRALRILLLDEPTRGVDVGAREEIHNLVLRYAAEGGAVILVASELDEIERLCDRVVVIREGRVVGVLTGADVTEERILETAFATSVPSSTG